MYDQNNKCEEIFSIFGVPLKTAYVDLEGLGDILYATGLHRHHAYEFALSVFIKSFPNHLLHIFIFGAYLASKDHDEVITREINTTGGSRMETRWNHDNYKEIFAPCGVILSCPRKAYKYNGHVLVLELREALVDPGFANRPVDGVTGHCSDRPVVTGQSTTDSPSRSRSVGGERLSQLSSWSSRRKKTGPDLWSIAEPIKLIYSRHHDLKVDIPRGHEMASNQLNLREKMRSEIRERARGEGENEDPSSPCTYECENTNTTCYLHYSRHDNVKPHMIDKQEEEPAPKKKKRPSLADVPRQRAARAANFLSDETVDKNPKSDSEKRTALEDVSDKKATRKNFLVTDAIKSEIRRFIWQRSVEKQMQA
ncbi:hypothetical protein DAPPUDRAFT_262463 [Daphnia pulex]|uniref:Uncharacterized protein n=1 Tax=Daphnia pulex TaxID=6669 RepID=E9HN17_DAPPU|nr:hypothetical protein DAPPUDRAFT_262463 [Daphnia pulex]|eukprot:EFX66848.1 hypothetical protein DAPPUDRAFT_262463 [Daphnia pulex]